MQPAELYEQIMQDGYFHFDGSKIEEDAWIYDYKPSYDWLVDEMKKRIGQPPNGIKYPVWAWYIHYSQHKKPDLRRAEYGRKGEQMVCMEIDIPDEQVVLSDEELWHFVLGNWYLSKATCKKDYDRDMKWFDKLSDDNKNKAITDSWQTIFDIEPFDNKWFIKGRFVQATFWELKAEQIIKVWFFKAR